MQYVNDINRIKGEEVLVREDVKSDVVKDLEIVAQNEAQENQTAEFSWVLVQIVLCILILGIILILKEFTPEIYEQFRNEYSKYIEQILLITDGEIKIINDYV